MKKKDVIINGATELFVAKGFSASTNELISRVGIAKGTLYHHFKSKDQLIVEIYKTLMFEIETECVSEMLEEEDPLAYTKDVFAKIVRWFIKNPSKFHYINSFEASPYSSIHALSLRETLNGPQKNIMQKVNMGVMKNYSTELITFFDFAFTRSTANYFLSQPNPMGKFRQEFDEAFDLYWNGASR
ncbi:TetR/AcrR family transcriptional regulator [Saccharicrinis fermentans]|uniref:HTH-type transcriptional repressor KstR2 n=1 Tax=Saccharicrinis fermentans DSM 9555 = JCM 21142 TaxID=869213 RepID=W7Y722_9BACT|nr:TetR/AcrR family transcriptional regulator [Saccharicrinis fermentans]GAF03458.1 HTH-type transcriptional repressor KstR2 [Saccharicrinis fermentans DSM 9555 = JCM 21142]